MEYKKLIVSDGSQVLVKQSGAIKIHASPDAETIVDTVDMGSMTIEELEQVADELTLKTANTGTINVSMDRQNHQGDGGSE